MKHCKRFLILIALVAAVALLGFGCGDSDPADGDTTGTGHVANQLDAHAIEGAYLVKASAFAGKGAADWANAKHVRVEMNEFSFVPNSLTFETGVPYILELVNTGEVKHEFTAEDFNNVAFRKIEDASGEFKGPTPLEVETFAGMETELFLIPLAGNTYKLVCEIQGASGSGDVRQYRGRACQLAPPFQ